MPEPAGHSVTGITKHLFQDLEGAWFGTGVLSKPLYLQAFLIHSDRDDSLIEIKKRRRESGRAAAAAFCRLPAAPRCIERYHARIADNGLIHDRRVLQSAGMRDLPSTNAAWMEECHDVYECCAFADCRRNLRADTVRLHSHEIDA
jgi:hypothetical protein